MKALILATLLASGAASGVLAADIPSVEIRNAVATVEVLAENRSDIAVTLSQGSSNLPPVRIEHQGGHWVLDGGVGEGRTSCLGNTLWFGSSSVGGQRVRVRGLTTVRLRDAPHIVVHMPLDVRLAADGAVFGTVSPSASLGLSARGCGDWRLGEVRGDAELSMNGSGDVRGEGAGRVKGAIVGSGDLSLTEARGGADLSVNGSGDVHLARVEGPVRASVAGSGDIRIADGHAPQIQVSLNGSGDFTFGGAAGSVQAATAGSGDIRIHSATGPVSSSKAGSGDITIGK